jgi:Uma2 family endonuclease
MPGAVAVRVHGTLAAMLELESLAPERVRPLRRREYERLIEAGVFEDEHVELLHGVLVEMSPQGGPHSSTSARLAELLTLAVRGRAQVRSHSPFAASDDSMPEPDVQVVPRGSHDDHPETAFLVAEVADSSLRKDRRIKPGIYAAAGIPVYWIVDVEGEAVEVLSEPVAGGYGRTVRVERGGVVRLAGFDDVAIPVDDLFQ